MNLLPPPVSKCEQQRLKHEASLATTPPTSKAAAARLATPPQPPPQPPARKYARRGDAAERDLMAAFERDGLDREDAGFLKRAFEALVEAADAELGPIAKRIKWVDLPALPESVRASTMTAARIRDFSDTEERARAKALAHAFLVKGRVDVCIRCYFYSCYR
jgi:hypothetical protein